MNSTSAISTPIVILFLLFTKAQCSVRNLKLSEFQTKLHRKTPSSSLAATPFPSPAAPPSPKSNGRVFYPIGYGADPTGAADSAPAILEALTDAGKLQKGADLLPGIADLAAVIDLQGGVFSVGSPIRFPPDIGNIAVQGGTLRASSSFPVDRHLVELWAPDSPKASTSTSVPDKLFNRKDFNNGQRYEDIIFHDVLFDSSYQGGGLLVVDAARIRIINSFFLHFTTEGILVQRGHETFISDCFLGQHETIGGDRTERDYSGTAIDLASTDNAITDVTIFSAATGIILRGRANIVTGVHCYNKATYFGGVGISVKSAQNRIVGAYLDYNSIVIEDPDQIHISNGFFLGDGNIVLKSVQGRVSGLTIVNNIFSGDPTHNAPTVGLDGSFSTADQVVIDQNVADGMRLRSTVGKVAVGGNGTKWVADFSGVLLFPNKINHLQYSFYARGGIGVGFPAHAVTNVSDNVVVIESQEAVNAVVSVFVDQYSTAGEVAL